MYYLPFFITFYVKIKHLKCPLATPEAGQRGLSLQGETSESTQGPVAREQLAAPVRLMQQGRGLQWGPTRHSKVRSMSHVSQP